MRRKILIIMAILLLIAIFDLPYGYYAFLRIVTVCVFGYLAYEAKQAERIAAFFIYLGLAVLFQPLFKIALGRTVWNSVDVLVAAGLLISVFFNSRKT